jgi:hypothetical protein
MSINPNMANREVADLLFCDYKTKAPFLNLDFANVSTTNLTATRVFATGGQGAPNRVGFDGQRKGTLKIETQITPMKLYSMLSGNAIAASGTYARKEVLTSATKVLTLTKTPVTGTVFVFAEGDDCGTPVVATVAGTSVTLTTATDGVYIVRYLEAKTTGNQTVKFTASVFPKAFTVYGSTPYKTEDDEIVAMNLTYYKAQPQATVDLAFSNTGDPSKLTIDCDLLADSDGNIYDMSLEGAGA